MDERYRIHDEAASAFDGRAVRCRDEIKQIPAPTRRQGARPWKPDIVATHVPRSDIHAMRICELHPVERIYEEKDGALVGLTGDPAAEFFKLAEQIWRAIKPKEAASRERVFNLACDWLFGGNSDIGLTEYCLAAIASEAQLTKVWVPISGLYIQDAFEVGYVTFEELSGARISSWHKSAGYHGLDTNDRIRVDQHYAEFAKTHQGRAVGWTEVNADKEQARLVALDRVEDALAMVRFFCPSTLMPSSRSLCTPSGRERNENYNVILERSGAFAGASRGILDADHARNWRLDRAELSSIRGAGLGRLSELLKATELSSFQQRVLASVRVFSDAALETRLQIKLVLALSALEGVYLGSRNEPIQQNVGERLALVTEHDPQARRALTKLVRDVYETRSKFVHHAEQVDSTDAIRSFFRCAWLGVVRAIELADDFVSVKEFTDAIDMKKFQ